MSCLTPLLLPTVLGRPHRRARLSWKSLLKLLKVVALLPWKLMVLQRSNDIISLWRRPYLLLALSPCFHVLCLWFGLRPQLFDVLRTLLFHVLELLWSLFWLPSTGRLQCLDVWFAVRHRKFLSCLGCIVHNLVDTLVQEIFYLISFSSLLIVAHQLLRLQLQFLYSFQLWDGLRWNITILNSLLILQNEVPIRCQISYGAVHASTSYHSAQVLCIYLRLHFHSIFFHSRVWLGCTLN